LYKKYYISQLANDSSYDSENSRKIARAADLSNDRKEFPSILQKKKDLANSRSTFAHKIAGGCQTVVVIVAVAATTDSGETKFNWIYRSVFSFPHSHFPHVPAIREASILLQAIR